MRSPVNVCTVCKCVQRPRLFMCKEYARVCACVCMHINIWPRIVTLTDVTAVSSLMSGCGMSWKGDTAKTAEVFKNVSAALLLAAKLDRK